jgi:hypothetical protein
MILALNKPSEIFFEAFPWFHILLSDHFASNFIQSGNADSFKFLIDFGTLGGNSITTNIGLKCSGLLDMYHRLLLLMPHYLNSVLTYFVYF